MCTICGCSDGDHVHSVGHDAGHGHGHSHSDDDHSGHGHGHSPPAHQALHDARRSTVAIERNVLAHNDAVAHENRHWFAHRRIFALNVLSSPGAGKTTLLERMIRDRVGGRPIWVVEGDQATDFDSRRIREAGARATQVNTGAGCHLDAIMVARAVRELDPPAGALLAIENVGNLVCPALFDLGEGAKLVVASVAEGEDKPSKYPHMFRAADAVVMNKMDLLPHVRFDLARFVSHLRATNGRAAVLPLSATTGEGVEALDRWLRERGCGSGGPS
jgi:hydrogenase nickel incorporation protein HypB